jgi:hypothetical protein
MRYALCALPADRDLLPYTLNPKPYTVRRAPCAINAINPVN